MRTELSIIVASMTENVCNTLPVCNLIITVTAQFAEKNNSRSVKSQIRLAETFDLKLAVNNRYQCN